MSHPQRPSLNRFKPLCSRTGRANRPAIQSMIDQLSDGLSLYPKRAHYKWHPGVPQSRKDLARIRQRLRHLKRALKTAPLEVNQRGNRVDRTFRNTGTDEFARTLPAQGFEQYPTSQDAAWFGVWLNIADRKVFTFAEGDCIMVSCPTQTDLIAEIEYLKSCYGPPSAFMWALDQDGTVTRYIESTPAVELVEAV
ncbi:hypothetical protein [Paraburkholderia humisilvae]|uniref:Uncharacterized protein n=1 Tax=Paraburkholderia humisilvae TaxID=627669 RepID=A0A6J5DKA4_9BURK|nr:hypothetical protein [Paraburkholderia humisilvae]CAB3754720.1 hypothetical protein LMG29542_02434 [Paraburkholderia humisilvae]